MQKKKLIVSFSGGRTSAYMLWFILNEWEHRSEYEIKVVFANTGLEDSETLVFVHRCSIYFKVPIVWVEARHLDDNGKPFSPKGWAVKHQVVDFFTAAKKPYHIKDSFTKKHLTNPPYWKSDWSWTPFEEMISVLGIPSTNAPTCSPQLKRKAIESYARSIGWKGYYTAIGIRYDEPKRISPAAKKRRLIYVLAEDTVMAKYDILTWWKNHEFDLNVKTGFGNCDMCWKKSIKQLVSNAKTEPGRLDWWQHITDTYGNLNPRNTNLNPPFNFYRGNISPADILKMANEGINVPDEKLTLNQLNCHESCEAF